MPKYKTIYSGKLTNSAQLNAGASVTLAPSENDVEAYAPFNFADFENLDTTNRIRVRLDGSTQKEIILAPNEFKSFSEVNEYKFSHAYVTNQGTGNIAANDINIYYKKMIEV